MRPYAITFDHELDMTKQSFKKECDINEIMAKFTKTGVINHTAKYEGQYGVQPNIEYMDALQIVIDADNMFAELPAEVRKKFDNDPAKFLKFAENPDNIDAMREMGLAEPLPEPKTPPVSATATQEGEKATEGE